MFKQLKSDFKRTINWDKCQSEKTMHAKKPIFRSFYHIEKLNVEQVKSDIKDISRYKKL